MDKSRKREEFFHNLPICNNFFIINNVMINNFLRINCLRIRGFGMVNQNIMLVLVIIFGLIFCQTHTSYQDDSASRKVSIRTNNTENFILPPLEQVQIGTAPEDVKCNYDYVLVVKVQTGKPYCITVHTAQKLVVERGWGRLVTILSPTTVDLRVSISNGTSPLTVGFFLKGVKIYYIKDWNFGDNHTDYKTHNILENNLYSYPFSNHPITTKTFYGYVNVTDPVTDPYSQHPITKSFKITVSKNDNRFISNFFQNEGIIYQEDSDGFDVNTANVTNPVIHWTFGDEQTFSANTQPPEDTPNPFHKYNKDGTLNGIVSVTQIDYPKNNTEYWKFAVLVVNRTTTGEIMESLYPHQPIPGLDQFKVNQKLSFYVDIGTSSKVQSTKDFHEVFTYLWNFDDGTKPVTTNDVQVYHVYNQSKNYLVNCTITDNIDSLHLNLWKAVSIIH